MFYRNCVIFQNVHNRMNNWKTLYKIETQLHHLVNCVENSWSRVYISKLTFIHYKMYKRSDTLHKLHFTAIMYYACKYW